MARLYIDNPDRLYIDKKDRNLYMSLKNEEFFKDRANKELFLFAMAIGFKYGEKLSLESREGFVRTEYLRPEDIVLMYATAVFENNGDITVIRDKDKVCKIAEEYAHAGIRILTGKIESIQLGTFEKNFEKEMFELYNMKLSSDSSHEEDSSY